LTPQGLKGLTVSSLHN